MRNFSNRARVHNGSNGPALAKPTPSKLSRRVPASTGAMLVTLLFAQFASCPVGAAESDPPLIRRVKQLEGIVIGVAPDDESCEQRLNAMEMKLFGHVQSGAVLDRLERIKDSIAGVDEGEPSQEPTKSRAPVNGSISTSMMSGPGRSELSSSRAIVDDPLQKVLIPQIESLLSPSTKSTNKQSATKSTAQGDAKLYDEATAALDKKEFGKSETIYTELTKRNPKDARYFYGLGMAQQLQKRNGEAFANFVIACHLDSSPRYLQAANALTAEMQHELDSNFKLKFRWQLSDQQSVLNAGTRLWKAGYTKAAINTFEYALKNLPLCRGIAAYDLGAVAEYNGDLKTAHQYYLWADKENARLAAEVKIKPMLATEINKSLNIFPKGYIEQATLDVQHKLLNGDVTWNGWTQAITHPVYWSSEVCPLCAISRTEKRYDSEQQLR